MDVIDISLKFDFPYIEEESGYEVFNEDWLITVKGDMKCRRGGYNVWYEMLKQDDIILHLMEKRWFDANTFLPAFCEACKRAGIIHMSLLTHY